MSDWWGPLLLFVVTGLWFSLALGPSLAEWSRKTDAGPLQVQQDNDGDIRHFAHQLRRYLESNLAGGAGLSAKVGRLPDGTLYRVLATVQDPLFTYSEKQRHLVRRLLVIQYPASLPGEISFARDVYAVEHISFGGKNIFRSVLGEKDIKLGAGCVVSRWMHAGGDISAEADCTFYGRLSSEGAIRISVGSVFQRMNAAAIAFDEGAVLHAGMDEGLNRSHDVLETVTDRWLIEGQIEVPAGGVLESNIVASGNIRIGDGARITGSIKSNGNILIGDNVVIMGSIVSRNDLQTGASCHLMGPVIAERDLILGDGSRLGTRKYPTSATARRIFIGVRSVAFGTVWAKQHGEVREAMVKDEILAA